MNKNINFSWMKTHVLFAGVFILLLALDRITKQWAVNTLMKGDITIWEGVLKFHYLENRGAAWGLFENAFWLFYIVTAVVIVIMGYFYSKIPFEKKYILLRFILVILCAGAVGNFIDRALYRYVVDFIWFEIINFPVFNVADFYLAYYYLSSPLLLSFLFIYNDDDKIWGKYTGKDKPGDETSDNNDEVDDDNNT